MYSDSIKIDYESPPSISGDMEVTKDKFRIRLEKSVRNAFGDPCKDQITDIYYNPDHLAYTAWVDRKNLPEKAKDLADDVLARIIINELQKMDSTEAQA